MEVLATRKLMNVCKDISKHARIILLLNTNTRMYVGMHMCVYLGTTLDICAYTYKHTHVYIVNLDICH